MFADIETFKQRVVAEFDEYYTAYDPCTAPLLAKMDELAAQTAGESSYSRKAAMHEMLARECPVHLFRETPFFFEISSGRGRYTWGGLQSPVGSYFHDRTANEWLNIYGAETEPDRRNGYLHAWNNPVGFDHHCPGYDKILTLGINGILRQAEEALASCTDKKKRDFCRAVIRSNRALLHLAGRFAAEAARLAETADDADTAAHYRKIADAAAWVPANPPRTLYEGLCTVLFYRECVGSLEGIGFSTFGQLDRMLYPLYRDDLAAGRITRDEAFELFCGLLLYTEVRFDAARGYHETSTTIELGGCDRAGNVVYNGLTALILDAVLAMRSINTKINCRISKRHPDEYLRKIADIQLANIPTVMMHNDDVLIPARVNCGQDIEDARMYVGGGCHEIVLQGTEVCTRADTWINLPRILLGTLDRLTDAETECPDYETFYAEFLTDVRNYYLRIVELKNEQERKWCSFDPLPLYSSSLTGCLEQGLDLTEGGAKYNSTALSMLGTATLIDSLYAVKTAVFDRQRVPFAEFRRVVSENFEDQEFLRQQIILQLPKHGTGNAELDAFSVAVLEDLSGIAGQTNGRGGKYLPAFYPHDIYNPLGRLTGATPDGRKAGQPLSRGVSPSEFIHTDSPLDLIHSLKPIDFTKFADSFCAELTLPAMDNTETNAFILTAIIRSFLEAEGSSLQFNLINKGDLALARVDPENHKNVLVRVCGYSAVYVYLSKETQDEIFHRAVR